MRGPTSMRRQFVAITGLTAIAQFAGFVKLWFTARLFGIGPELDGYFLALVVPILISGVLSGVLQTALFPVRARLAAERDTAAVQRFERGVLAVLLAVGTVIALVYQLYGQQALALSGSNISPAVLEAAQFVLPFVVVLIPLNAVGDGLGYLLAMRERYPVAAAAPIANALLGAAMLAAWPEGGLLNLALGTVLGVALQVAICSTVLVRTGFTVFGKLPAREELGREWLEMIRLSAWIFPGVVFANLTATLPTVLIASYGEGAVSAFGYAWRFHQYTIQLLVMAASPLLLARFAQLVAVGDEETVRVLLRKAGWISGGLGLLSIGIVVTLGEPLLRQFFSARVDSDAASQVTGHWLWLSFALGPALLGNVCAKVWQARGRAGFMSLLAGLGFAIFLLASQLLVEWLDSYAVAAAIGLSTLVVLAAGWHAAWRAEHG